jgi:3-deoxy-D-manno-octulosonate 8-phosphate phosphatase (KDO 8-P phosphatase)
MTPTERAAKIKLLMMDCDGVLTDGTIHFIPMPDGKLVETKGFNAQDGLALQWLHQKGIQTGIISGRTSPAVKLRAETAHMAFLYEGYLEKIPIIDEILLKSGLSPEEIAFVGDDVTDIVVMNRVGLGIAVANARPEVKKAAHFVTNSPGGNGGIRDAAELILKAKGLWPSIVAKYEMPEGS